MRAAVTRWSVLILMLLGSVMPAWAQLTADKVQDAINKGCAYLKRQQNPQSGGWEEYPGYPHGITCLTTLALLSCGVPPNDPEVARALTYLRDKRLDKTYTLALQTMVFCQASPVRDRALIEHNVKILQSTQIHGARGGAWSYPDIGATMSGDNSNAQFALLALHEADLIGVKVDPQVWRLARKYWEESQNPDGSWGYHPDESGRGSMTCAGITSMIITAGHVGKGDASATGDQVQCCGAQDESDSVERGLIWLGKHFTVQANPTATGRLADAGGALWRLYYLYGLERVGRMSARRFIGQHDWYREGAEALLADQDQLDFYWKGREAASHANNLTISTSFALLFLSKGRRPVIASKLKFGEDNDWNRHRNDLANLSAYVEKKWHAPVTWQVIDFKRSSLEDLLQTPVLYISGSQALKFSDDQVKLLRDYVDRGGFLFAEATCAQCQDFHRSFVQLMQRVFTEPEYQLKLLAPEHPMWHAEEKVPVDLQRPLWGVEYGCRTCVAYVPPPRPEDPPASLSCLWELWQLGRNDTYSPAVVRQIGAANSIGINILAYATNRELKPKEAMSAAAIEVKGPADKLERGKLYVANLRHPGGCDIAPAAIPNLLRTAEKQLKMRVGIKNDLVPIHDDRIFEFPLLFMHGRNAFKLSDHERELLRTYLTDREGTLFADAICANKAFADAFRAEMAVILPKAKLEPIPASHPIWTQRFGGFDCSKVRRRESAAGNAQGILENRAKVGPPELEGVKIGDRYAVIFSPYDLSCALEKKQSIECDGYASEDAEKIGLNIILYFLQGSEGQK